MARKKAGRRPARRATARARPVRRVNRNRVDDDTTSTVASDSPLPRGLAVVGIGASAGGLEVFTQLIEALPADAGLVVILLQHMAPDHESGLVYLLSSHTRMPVTEVTQNIRVRANHIYVVPPNVRMELFGDRLVLSPRPSDRSRHTPIDTFFASMAKSVGTSAIAVVLSGTASDGALGLRDIKAAGGITIVQKPETAKFDGMPRAALATGIVDLVMSPAEIGAELARIADHPYTTRSAPGGRAGESIADTQLARVFDLLKPLSGIDFRQYKQPTIRRRLMRRMALHRIDDVEGYLRILKANPSEVRALFQDLLIHVTRFFREPESFDALAAEVFPNIFDGREPSNRPVRFWVCGCATGEEAYSLAIATIEFLNKHDLQIPVQIFATDVSETAIEHARAGVYSHTIANDVRPERLRRFFAKADGSFRISKEVRDLCVFARQDLTKDPPFSRLDLILCRNVLIYMDAALQKRLIGVFHYALNLDGFLMLGHAETVGAQASLFSVSHKKHKIHRKKSVAAAVMPMALSLGKLPPAIQRKRIETGMAGEKSLEHETNRLMLERFAPPGVVVDDDVQIIQFRGQVGPYLEPAPGDASLNLLKMAREGLLYGLRTALTAARKGRKPVRRSGMHVRSGDDWLPLAIEVVPMTALGRQYFLVLFDESTDQPSKPVSGRRKATRPDRPAARDSGKMALLQRELAASRDYLQSIIQELEAANEELQSANEEILSSNEELQSTNEELDTAKEELQSTNEELNTLNEELQGRNEEVNRVNSDLVNLLASVQIAIVIVSSDLRIRRFTPMAERVLNLIPGDVDRVIGHINPNIDCPDLEQLIIESVETVAPIERDVRDRQGKWYSLRIRPYKSIGNKIDGAVLALFDVDQLKRSEQRAQLAQGLAYAVLSAADRPLALLDRDLRVRQTNEPFAALFGLRANDLRGRTLAEIGGNGWRIDGWASPDGAVGTQLPPVNVTSRGIGRDLVMNGTIVQSPDDVDHTLILVAAEGE